MIGPFALLLLSVALGGSFGDAEAAASIVDDATMELELVVDAGESQSVVARIIDAGAEATPIDTVALAQRSNGIFAATFEMRRFDAVVVFEVVETGEQSRPTTLSALGARDRVLGPQPSPSPEIVIDDQSAGRLWLPLGLTLAAVAALLVWYTLGMRSEEGPVTPDGAA